MYARAKEQDYHPPFDLPRRWIDGKDKLDLQTPFNFVSTADTIGGNSGSPVLNRAGEFVGINFDRNRHGLVRNFVYTDHQARHISSPSPREAIVEVAAHSCTAPDGLVQGAAAPADEPRTSSKRYHLPPRGGLPERLCGLELLNADTRADPP